MPPNRVQEMPYLITEILDSIWRRWRLMPLYLGGTAGPGGGSGGGPGGYIGGLVQSHVTYDTTEYATVNTSANPSLYDNLAHMRADIRSAGHIHGLSTWQVPAGTVTIELVDFWEELDWVSVNGFMFSPMYVSLNDEHSQIVFNAALGGSSVVIAQGVIARME